jgi:hypothetical protein
MDVYRFKNCSACSTPSWQQSVVLADIQVRLEFRLEAPIASDLWAGCLSALKHIFMLAGEAPIHVDLD